MEPDTGPLPPPRPAAPIAASERVELIDILRGFAIFGILVVNMQLFFSPLTLMMSPERWWHGTLDRTVETLILFLAQGKFYTLFSFLFGVGLAVQLERARARGNDVAGLFARRLLWLLAIGLIHAFLIWFGDILVTYAIFGLLLIPFRNRKNKTLLIWTIVLLLLPLLVIGGITGLVELGKLTEEGRVAIDEAFAEQAESTSAAIARAREVYPVGSYGEVFRVRLEQVGLIYMVTFLFGFGISILGIFLIGLNVGRRRILQEIDSHLPTIRRGLPWLLGIGLLGTTISVTVMSTLANPGAPSLIGLLAQACAVFGVPAMTFSYVGTIAILSRSPRCGPWLSLLAPVGRMALTNYLTHSIVMTFVANGYGLGLYGRVSPAMGLLLTFVLYGLQIPLSGWWLRRFRFGPVEWLWRSLTYRRLQPMRIAGPAG